MKITPYLPGMHIYMARKKIVKTKGADELAGVRDLLRGKADFSIIEGKAKSGANSRDRGYSRANVFILFLLQVLGG